jgi:hypothetical protein
MRNDCDEIFPQKYKKKKLNWNAKSDDGDKN